MKQAVGTGIIAILTSTPQDHWKESGQGATFSYGPTGCTSTELYLPRLIIEPASMGSDYGYGGEIFEHLVSARLVLRARCSKCQCETEDAFDIDDPFNVMDVIELIVTGPHFDDFVKALNELRKP